MLHEELLNFTRNMDEIDLHHRVGAVSLLSLIVLSNFLTMNYSVSFGVAFSFMSHVFLFRNGVISS